MVSNHKVHDNTFAAEWPDNHIWQKMGYIRVFAV